VTAAAASWLRKAPISRIVLISGFGVPLTFLT
jgi:hypothetical protein